MNGTGDKEGSDGMSDKPQDWHAEALDADGKPLGAPISEPEVVVDHLTATSIAHNVHYGCPDPDPDLAARTALNLAEHVAGLWSVQAAREGLRLWVELYHRDEPNLLARANAALAEITEGGEGRT